MDKNSDVKLCGANAGPERRHRCFNRQVAFTARGFATTKFDWKTFKIFPRMVRKLHVDLPVA